jgi:serpin B
MKDNLINLVLLLIVSALALSACGPTAVAPSPLPTPQTGDEPAGLLGPAGSRDAVLTYLTGNFGDQAPATGLVWTEKQTKPEGLVGTDSYEYTSGDWVIDVSYPVVAPENVVYTIAVTNQNTGFRWEGQVDANGVVTETSFAGQSSRPSDPVGARDAVLAYLAGTAGEEAPAAGLAWAEKHTTPEGLVGGESYEYTSGDWVVDVSYPVVAPENVVYTVVVTNQVTGFRWEGQVDASGNVKESTSQATPVPGGGQGDVAALVQGNSAFAFALYQALKDQDGNLFFSPYSISQALAMTYAGARAETEQQMARTLHFDLPQDRLYPAFKSLDQELAQRGQGAQGKDGEGFRLNVVNALWGQTGYQFLPAFLDLLSANYGAGLRFVDYVQAAEEARTTINDWVSEQTEGKIQDLIAPGVLNDLTRLVLTNAIYFNAAWATPFVEDMTQDGAFTRLDGSQVTVPMMRQNESLGYAEGAGYQVVELPYDGQEMSMVILLPAKGQFQAFESALDAARVEAILQELAPGQVALTVPRFKFDSAFSLKDALSQMGMPVAFTADADFSGMTGNRELFISAVLHKAFVSVDEAGTEAAAATAVVVGLLSAPPTPVEVTVDRPFLFLIRDLKTGTVLFVGRVVDPTQ